MELLLKINILAFIELLSKISSQVFEETKKNCPGMGSLFKN
jgi:hypothetical protein